MSGINYSNDMQNSIELEYLSTLDLSKYKNEWIAIVGKTVIAHGHDVKKVYANAAKLSPTQTPLMLPCYYQDDTLILGGVTWN